MKAAVLHEYGQPPRYEDFPEATPGEGEVRLAIRAAALSRLAFGQTLGGHYAGPSGLPFVVGVDGVGETPDGARVYTGGLRPPYGTMAERATVARARCVSVPDGIDDATAAAIPNAAMASWLALDFRARLTRGESVLVLGATGTAGRLALPIARHLGAAQVVVAGRNAEALAALTSEGADAAVSLAGSDAEVGTAIAAALREHPVDVIIDFVWGRAAVLTLQALTGHGADPTRRIRFVTVGSMEALTAAIPSAPLRSGDLTILGSGIGSTPMAQVFATFPRIFALAREGTLRVATEVVPLADVASNWQVERPGRRRLVFRP